MIERIQTIKLGAILMTVVLITLGSCGKDTPDRDEIPLIKDQISKLENFYTGATSSGLDSFMTETFYADMGQRGKWQSIAVDAEIWPFIGFRNRMFYYSKTEGEVELNFHYRSPDSLRDSTIAAKIALVKEDDLWKVSSVTEVKPIY